MCVCYWFAVAIFYAGVVVGVSTPFWSTRSLLQLDVSDASHPALRNHYGLWQKCAGPGRGECRRHAAMWTEPLFAACVSVASAGVLVMTAGIGAQLAQQCLLGPRSRRRRLFSAGLILHSAGAVLVLAACAMFSVHYNRVEVTRRGSRARLGWSYVITAFSAISTLFLLTLPACYRTPFVGETPQNDVRSSGGVDGKQATTAAQ